MHGIYHIIASRDDLIILERVRVLRVACVHSVITVHDRFCVIASEFRQTIRCTLEMPVGTQFPSITNMNR